MPNSRRSSTDTRRSSTDTARSFSMSFGKIDLPLRYVVDIKQQNSGHESGYCVAAPYPVDGYLNEPEGTPRAVS